MKEEILKEGDLFIFNFIIKDVDEVMNKVNSILENKKNVYYTPYTSIKDLLWQKRKIDFPEILKIVGEERLSTKNIDKIQKLEGTIYPYITEKDNDSELNLLLNDISEVLNDNNNTTRLIVRNLPNITTYYKSLQTPIDVPCAVLFHYLYDRYIVNFRAHALKSEFISDFCLIYKYYFYPVYKKIKGEKTYQIISNTTQEIDYLKTDQFKNFVKFINEPY